MSVLMIPSVPKPVGNVNALYGAGRDGKNPIPEPYIHTYQIASNYVCECVCGCVLCRKATSTQQWRYRHRSQNRWELHGNRGNAPATGRRS